MSALPNFDRIARIYRWAEYVTLGPLLQKARTHFLPRLNTSREALVFGDGDGRFTEKLLDANAHVHVKAVDISTSMLSLLRKRCATHATRLTTEHANAMVAVIPPATDLVATHFFLDCLTQDEVNQLTAFISQHCESGTLWLLSDFAVPANWLAVPSRIYIRSLYFAFRMLTNLRVQHLPDPQSALTQAGFNRIKRYTLLGGLIYTEIWQRA